MSPFRLAFLASGAGTTFEAVVHSTRSGELDADVSLLILSQDALPAASRAGALAVESIVLDEKRIGREACDAQMARALQDRHIDLVVLTGYLRKVGPRTLAAFKGRIINTHPAPLPRFGGRGMYGEHVHRAVLDANVSESAATVHWADAEYDTGPVIAERRVPVAPSDDVASLRERVQHAERALLVDTIRQLRGDAAPR